MVIDKELLALSDVANICGTSNSNVSNWRKRDNSFPVPFAETSAGPIWKSEDIVEYLHQKKKYDAISTGNLKTKTISIIGRARSGKSFLGSRFVMDKVGFVKLFCGNSNDKTVCPIHIKISESILLESFSFHTNFNSIYSDSDSETIALLREKIKNLMKGSYSQEDIYQMNEIEEVIRKIREIENDYQNRKKVSIYIDTYQKPSLFCKELLRECGLGSIQIIDTPGVSGNVEPERIVKSDMYIFLVKPDNSDEAQTLKKIVMQIKADVATSKVAFLYKKEGLFFTKEKYEEAQNTVKNDMIAFSDLFSDLKGSIIATELDVLNPSSHCILFPTMGEEVSPPEELFLQAMREKLIEAFLPEDTDKEDKEFQNIILEKEDSAKKLVIDIMNNITPHDLKDGTNNYGLEDIIAENHNRVMTKDHYRLHSDLDAAYDREIKLLDEYFSKFKPDDYKDEWQQKIIKYIYKRLTQSVRQDRGLGVGTHPWEEHPSRTMLVEESILADKILVGINPEEKWMMNEPYKKAFKDNNITSSTWNYVGCVNDIDAIIKLEIIKNHLSQIEVYTRQDLVLCRYIGGLRQIAQYKILKLMGKEDTVAMDILREMPFCNSSESSAQDS